MIFPENRVNFRELLDDAVRDLQQPLGFGY
jgi:hypothetical protein